MTTRPHPYRIVMRDAAQDQWLLFQNPVQILVAEQPEMVLPLLREIEHAVFARHWHAAGFIAYEAAPAFDSALATRPCHDFPLAWFGLYQEPETIHLPLMVDAPLPAPDWKASVSEVEFHAVIHQIKKFIQSGDTYQVNYTFRLRALITRPPWDLFVQLTRAQGPCYGAFIDTPDWSICSASPELFFQLNQQEIASRPMKGTAPRGLWTDQDRQQASWLKHSPKNRAENVMIVDMMRNDLGKIAQTGTVRVTSLFDTEQYPTLWQMTSTVRAATQASMAGIFQAAFPAASITGAPKPRTMRLIAELETAPRKIYTGSIGFIAPNRSAQFNVAIRTVLINKQSGMAEYGVGAGIVWDSSPSEEFHECLKKADIVTQAQPEFELLESLRWTPAEEFFLFEYHLRRLADSAAYFAVSLNVDEIRHFLTSQANRLPRQSHKIRLLVSRTGEYRCESVPLQSMAGPYRICLAGHPIHKNDPFLYHKTTHRRVYDEALATAPGFSDVLLWNEDGELTESCRANLAVEIQGELLTPPLSSGLLPGTYRAFLLQQGKLKEQIIRRGDLTRCTNIYLLNSVRGQWPVTLLAREALHSDG